MGLLWEAGVDKNGLVQGVGSIRRYGQRGRRPTRQTVTAEYKAQIFAAHEAAPQ